MSKYLTLGARFPWLTLFLLVLVSIWCIPQLQRLSFQISAEDIMLEQSEEREFYDLQRAIFGSDEGIILFLKDKKLLFADKVAVIRQAVEEIESLEFVTSTSSLLNLKHVSVDDNEMVHSSPYLDHEIHSEIEQAEWMKVMHRNPLIANNLLSADGKAMTVWIAFDKKSCELMFSILPVK